MTCFYLPQTHIFKPKLYSDAIKQWQLQESSTSMNKITAFPYERDLKELVHYCHHCRTQQAVAIRGKWVFSRPEICWCRDLGLCSLQSHEQ